MVLYYLFSVSQIPVFHHRIWYFSVMGGVRRGWGLGCGGLHVSKERGGGIKKGEMKKERGADTPFCTMTVLLTNFTS